MGMLFDCSTDNIGLHLKNIFASGEQEKDSVTEKSSATASDGKNYITQFYNLDAVISVGYRVNRIRATLVPMRSEDGKMHKEMAADQEQLIRLIQSIPSPMAEPFKQWMAQVASHRLDQMQDPELSIEQAVMDYKRLGYSDAWINQRIRYGYEYTCFS